MKKIVWITIDPFVDCDLIPIDQVSKVYFVNWIVVLPLHNARYSELEIKNSFINNNRVQIEFFYEKYGARDLRKVFDYKRLGSKASAYQGDLYYVNYSVAFPWYLLFWKQLPTQRRIITAHQGAVHIGMKNRMFTNLSRDLVYRNARLVNMFSSSQAELFHKRYPKSKIEIINLALKNYGIPTVAKASGKDSCIHFLSFGLINYAKNIDLLIDAACNLHEKGVRGFKVLIYGKCDNWTFYQEKIRYPELFETFTGFVSNDDIPNLLSKAHFFVQPYRVVSQSGAMKVAFQYNTPVIASNLPGLMDEIREGVNGFSFKAGDVEDLERVMGERIASFHDEYDVLCSKMNEYIQENYSPDKIGMKYIQMFDNFIK